MQMVMVVLIRKQTVIVIQMHATFKFDLNQSINPDLPLKQVKHVGLEAWKNPESSHILYCKKATKVTTLVLCNNLFNLK